MLCPLKLSFLLIFSHATSGHAISGFAMKGDRPFDLNQDFSWVRDIPLQAEKLAKRHQEEAKAIVKQATTLPAQYCAIAQDLAHKGNDIARESLHQKEEQSSSVYPKLLVFVSFSMPVETLKTIGSQVNQVGGKLVLRGLIKGSFKETLAKLKELQEEVMIDPTLFEAFHVNVVPTFILREERSSISPETGTYDRLQGNVSLNYVLEQFASKGSQDAKKLLQKLRSAL